MVLQEVHRQEVIPLQVPRAVFQVVVEVQAVVVPVEVGDVLTNYFFTYL